MECTAFLIRSTLPIRKLCNWHVPFAPGRQKSPPFRSDDRDEGMMGLTRRTRPIRLSFFSIGVSESSAWGLFWYFWDGPGGVLLSFLVFLLFPRSYILFPAFYLLSSGARTGCGVGLCLCALKSFCIILNSLFLPHHYGSIVKTSVTANPKEKKNVCG